MPVANHGARGSEICLLQKIFHKKGSVYIH